MRYPVLKTIILLFLLVITAQFVDRYFLDRRLNNFGSVIIKKPASYFFIRLEDAGFFLRSFIAIKNTILENENLKKENLSILSRLADYEDLKNENNFLRKALNISLRFSDIIAYAGVYNFQLGAGGYDVLLNKGANDGISDNNIIITEESVLVGKIKKANSSFSRIMAVNDSDFQVAVKVLGSDTAGMARGSSDGKLYLDLIIQSDLIKEGDLLVSSGLDSFPPALFVGTVSYVETNETDLFKKVRIKPAIENTKIGKVLIIRRN